MKKGGRKKYDDFLEIKEDAVDEVKTKAPRRLQQNFVATSQVILGILKAVGEITINGFFPHKYAKKYGYTRKRNTYHTALGRLERTGYISKKGSRENTIYRLTKKGEKEAFFAFINLESRTKPTKKQKWDGKWRIIFFDIPEKKRGYRDYLRTLLKAIGFREFQKSIWIYPYQIPEFFREVLFEENIKQYTRFITTNEVEYDRDLRKMFGLH